MPSDIRRSLNASAASLTAMRSSVAFQHQRRSNSSNGRDRCFRAEERGNALPSAGACLLLARGTAITDTLALGNVDCPWRITRRGGRKICAVFLCQLSLLPFSACRYSVMGRYGTSTRLTPAPNLQFAISWSRPYEASL